MTDRKLLRQEAGGLKLHADLSALASFHCNDMVVDSRGRAYVGNFGYDIFERCAAEAGRVGDGRTRRPCARGRATTSSFPTAP